MKYSIRERRKSLQLTQQDLARLCCTTAQRISDLENLKFHPADSEKAALAQHLQCKLDELVFRPQPAHKPSAKATQDLVLRFRCKSFYRPPRERTGESRLYTARKYYPENMRALEPLLERADICQFVDDAPFDSTLENVQWLERANREEACPAEVAPTAIGFDLFPVVCPKTRRCVGHCPVPAMVTARWLAILQVSVLTPALYTMDALVCTIHNGKRYFFALEIDGPGKPPPDPARSRALGIPILRMTKAEVLAGVGIGDKLDEYFAAL